MGSFVDQAKDCIPSTFNVKLKSSRDKKRYKSQKDKQTRALLELCKDARSRNQRKMSNWETVVAMAMEAEGARGSSPRYVADLGYALSREHLKTKLRALQKDLVPPRDILG
jgi:hypothetical protein